MPRAVYVRPEGVELGDHFGPGVPRGCLPVLPVTAKLAVKFPSALDHGGSFTLAFQRTALPLGDAYAVTDYFCQVRPCPPSPKVV